MLILHHRERYKPKIQTGNFPQIAARCFANSRSATHKMGQEKPEGYHSSQVACAYTVSYKEITSLPVSSKDRKDLQN